MEKVHYTCQYLCSPNSISLPILLIPFCFVSPVWLSIMLASFLPLLARMTRSTLSNKIIINVLFWELTHHLHQDQSFHNNPGCWNHHEENGQTLSSDQKIRGKIIIILTNKMYQLEVKHDQVSFFVNSRFERKLFPAIYYVSRLKHHHKSVRIMLYL